MIRWKYTIYCKAIDFVLDYLQFEKPIVKKDLHKEGQVADLLKDRSCTQLLGKAEK